MNTLITVMLDLLKGYEKDPRKLEEHGKVITGWIDTVDKLGSMPKTSRRIREVKEFQGVY